MVRDDRLKRVVSKYIILGMNICPIVCFCNPTKTVRIFRPSVGITVLKTLATLLVLKIGLLNVRSDSIQQLYHGLSNLGMRPL